ncbi:MAG TPA: SH3 domain-containing protein [Thermoflexales bacterium]|nr:SH3 domain-containing protein [Thermoflexales bacterium]
MKQATITTRIVTFGLAFAITLMSACGAAAAPLAASLTAPEANASVDVGKAVAITGKVTGTAVKQADVYVDGQKLATIAERSPSGEFVVSLPWSATSGGIHVIQLKGIDDKGEAITQSDPVFINVKGPAPTAAVPPTAIPQPTTPPQPTAVPATPTPAGATVTPADEFANVRSGPDTVFEKLGQLNAGQNAAVKGKSSDGKWLQIDFAAGTGGLAWVFLDVVKVTGSLDAVPVKQGPPRPVAVIQPTAIPQPTAVPQPTTPSLPAYALLPYKQNFRFGPRDDIGDVPLGMPPDNGKSSSVVYEILGATKAELEITAAPGEGIFAPCRAGDLSKVVGLPTSTRISLQLPSGQLPFSIEGGFGYYLFRIYVTKTDGSTAEIPRNVIVSCFKTQ